MNRFQQKFNELKKKNQKAFVPYIMAGDGGIACLAERLLTLEKFGATAVEVGIPFSDPVADGPTIPACGNKSTQKRHYVSIRYQGARKGKGISEHSDYHHDVSKSCLCIWD